MKNTIKYLIISLTIVLTGCSEKSQESLQQKPIEVVLGKPEIIDSAYILASGKVEAVKNANISTRIMGYVNSIPVKVGDAVSKGQLLISINSNDIEAQIAQSSAAIREAEAALINAENDYNRYQNLFATGSATQKELDNVTTQFEMSEARLEAAKQMEYQTNVQLSYTKIRAPFSGIITGKFTNEGAITQPGQPLLSMENQNNFQTTAMIPESEISLIKKGTSVEVEIKSLEKVVKGTVAEISTSALHTGGQYLVKIMLEETSFPIYSGMFSTVKFPIESLENSENTLMVPNASLVKKGGLTGIFTVSTHNTAILRWLRLGKVQGEFTTVLSGLTMDESIIIRSDAKLYNGAPIKVKQ